jgi:hypothetical protein
MPEATATFTSRVLEETPGLLQYSLYDLRVSLGVTPVEGATRFMVSTLEVVKVLAEHGTTVLRTWTEGIEVSLQKRFTALPESIPSSVAMVLCSLSLPVHTIRLTPRSRRHPGVPVWRIWVLVGIDPHSTSIVVPRNVLVVCRLHELEEAVSVFLRIRHRLTNRVATCRRCGHVQILPCAKEEVELLLTL